jgi:tetratricopeptide (TPR) repeat protein
MQLLPLAVVAIVAITLCTLLQAWSTDMIVHRAHGMLRQARNGGPNVDDLLAACCVECERAAARNSQDVALLRIWGGALLCRARRASREASDRFFLQAEQKYIAALESRPDDLKITIELLWVLWDRAGLHAGPAGLDLLERIGRECYRLLILYPQNSALLDFWGGALVSMGNRLAMPEADRMYAAAEEKYMAAISSKPDDQSIKTSLATLLWRRARRRSGSEAREFLARSEEWLESALRANPTDVRALSARAWLLFTRSRVEAGEEMDRLLANAAVQLTTCTDLHLRQATGVVLWAQGRLEEARQKLTEAETAEPYSAAYNLACVCSQMGDEAECRRWLEHSGEPGVLVSREQMSTEVELASVRERPWFREMLG